MPELSKTIHRIIARLETMLADNLLLQTSPPSWKLDSIYNNLSKTAVGFSFLTDPQNSLKVKQGSQYLVKELSNTAKLTQQWITQDHDSKATFYPKMINLY